MDGKVTKLRLTYFGYVMSSNSLEKVILLRLVSGKINLDSLGGPWLDTMQVNTRENIEPLKEAVQDLQMWKEQVHRITERWT